MNTMALLLSKCVTYFAREPLRLYVDTFLIELRLFCLDIIIFGHYTCIILLKLHFLEFFNGKIFVFTNSSSALLCRKMCSKTSRSESTNKTII